MAGGSGAVSSRQRLLKATLDLLAKVRDADEVSTRAICDRAGVQAPTLYHYFGDKRGLIDATASYAFEKYPHTADPEAELIDQLRQAWDTGLAFGLKHPALYAAVFGRASSRESTAAAEISAPLLQSVRDVAAAGLLALPADTAINLVEAAHTGAVLSTVAMLPARDRAALEAVRDAVLASIVGSPVAPSPAEDALSARAAAGALAAAIRDEGSDVLDAAESGLLLTWLDKFRAR